MEPRILFLDIETRPAIVASFGIRDQHIGHKQILKNGGIICVGLKWSTGKKVHVLSDWEHGHFEMLESVHHALSSADAVATYNGASFDIPKLMGEFLLAGLPPPPPPTQIDIYKSVRRLGFICNKLDYIAPLLGLGSKVKHPGLEMWLQVMEGDPKAQKRMARYCAGDVRLTEDVYNAVRGYIPNHPRLKSSGECPCGSSNVQYRGFNHSRHFKTQRVFCLDCRSWSTGKRTAA